MTSARPVPTRLPLPAAWRVEVFLRPDEFDPEGARLEHGARELGVAALRSARRGRGYLLSPAYSRIEVESIAREFLADPVVDTWRLYAPSESPPAPGPGTRRVLAAVLPGVMDPEARSVERLLVRVERTPSDGEPRVGTFRVFELEGELGDDDVATVGRKLVANETIEALVTDGEGLPYGVPAGESRRGAVTVPLREASPEQLVELSRDGQLSLDRTEMLAVQAHYRALEREPTLAELETIAQTWSEHCKHKTLTGIVEFEGERIDNLLKSTIKAATDRLAKPWCWSVFVDNAGIVEFEGDVGVCFKVETHNHPSAIDPYGGAGTGIGGVVRDILGAGLGARPVANTDAFFVGPLDLPDDELPKGAMHPRRILRGVVAGVRDYGNRMGIPTVNGGVWFHEGYVGNPLVYAGTVGVMRREHVAKEVRPGDLIVAVGGRTGRDGIHGATFSSIELSEHSETLSSHAVQIGDPVTEKQVLDCMLEARDRGLYRAVTDCGAGGFSSAVGEMGEKTGAEVHLESVPLKYPGLASHEIWISEAQERMVLAVPRERVEELLALFASEDVEAVVIGTFTDSKRLELYDRGELVGSLDMEFLHDGTPRPVRKAVWERPDLPDPGCPPSADPGADLLAILGRPNVQSREWIVRQYDHEVQGRSVVKPLVGVRGDGPSDGAIVRPVDTSTRGLAITCGANPEYGDLDPYAMATWAIDEALRNAVAVGADPTHAAILDNFSWGNCNLPDRLGSLVLAAKACHDAALAYGTPFVSGKDSLNNEYRVGDRTLAIPPTLLISSIAPVPDVRNAVTMDLKAAGNAIYLVGTTDGRLGGSQYHGLRGVRGGTVPGADLERAPALMAALHRALARGLARSCHDLSEGGLAVALAESCFAGGVGAEIAVAPVEVTTGDGFAAALFAESPTRWIVEVEERNRSAFESALEGMPLALLGRTTDEPRLRVKDGSGALRVDVELDALRAAHHGRFEG
ncbi:MAG: phosphoribosylformylglycinamidine synthase subunit PurL [Planctomycetota bacterium]